MKNITLRYNKNEQKFLRKYYCEITDEMDKFLLINTCRPHQSYLMYYSERSEIEPDQEGHIWSIRVPCATRGHITLDTLSFMKNSVSDTQGVSNVKL